MTEPHEVAAAQPDLTDPTPESADPRPPSVHEGRFGDVLAELDGVRERPVHEHVEVFSAVHTKLQDALTSIDEV